MDSLDQDISEASASVRTGSRQVESCHLRRARNLTKLWGLRFGDLGVNSRVSQDKGYDSAEEWLQHRQKQKPRANSLLCGAKPAANNSARVAAHSNGWFQAFNVHGTSTARKD